MHLGRLSVHLLFEPRDLWIGVYWTRQWDITLGRNIIIYLCLLPMLPIKLTWFVGPFK